MHLAQANFIGSTQKERKFKEESPGSELQFDALNESDSGHLPNFPLESMPSMDSTHKSHRGSQQGDLDRLLLPGRLVELGELGWEEGLDKARPGADPQPYDDPDYPKITLKYPKPMQKQTPGPAESSPRQDRYRLKPSQREPREGEEAREMLLNENVLPTYIGAINVFPHSGQRPARLPELPLSKAPEQLKTGPAHEQLDPSRLELLFQKKGSEFEQKKAPKPPRLEPDPAPAFMPPFLDQKAANRLVAHPSVQTLPETRRYYSPKELLEMNADLFESTQVHVWEKADSAEPRSPFELFNVASNKSLTMLDSKAAHLDSIRRLEFIEDERLGLLGFTFAEDGLIRTWRVHYSDRDQRYPPLPQEPKFVDAQAKSIGLLLPGLDATGQREAPPFFQQAHRRQIGRATSFINMDAPKLPSVKIKRGAILRCHSGAIFSSCSQVAGGVRRLFSGDRFGTVNCFDVVDGQPERIRVFRTGSEPVWALATLDADTLVTSSPNKVKVFSLSRSPERREELLFETNSSLFGQLKALSPSSFVVNSYQAETLANEFLVYDVVKQRVAGRMASNQLFCNAMAVISERGVLLSANEDKTVSLYDLRDPSQTQSKSFFAHSDAVMALDVCPDKNLLVTGGADSSVRLWDLRAQRIHNEIHAHRRKFGDSVLDVKFDAAGRLIGSAGADGILKIFHF